MLQGVVFEGAVAWLARVLGLFVFRQKQTVRSTIEHFFAMAVHVARACLNRQ